MCEFVVKTIIGAVVNSGILILFIKYVLDKKFEEYKTKENIRQKAILIADLLAEWYSDPDDRKRLNQLTWEAFIWLPKDIATRLSQCLSNKKDAPQAKDLIVDVRKIILGNEEAIDAEIIIHFSPKNESKIN